MAVLKRFSYDNIVEHNPTAPNPVEGGGGSGGGGGDILIIHGVLSMSEGDYIVTLDHTLESIESALENGLLPVVWASDPTGAVNIAPLVVWVPNTRVIFSMVSLSVGPGGNTITSTSITVNESGASFKVTPVTIS